MKTNKLVSDGENKYSIYCDHFAPVGDAGGYWNGKYAMCDKTSKFQPLVNKCCEDCKDFINSNIKTEGDEDNDENK